MRAQSERGIEAWAESASVGEHRARFSANGLIVPRSEKCMHNTDHDVKCDVAMWAHAGKAANLLLFIPASAARAGEKRTMIVVAPNLLGWRDRATSG